MRIRAQDAALAMKENVEGIVRRRLTDEHDLNIHLVSNRISHVVYLEVGGLSSDIQVPEVELGDVLDVQLLKEIGTLKIELLAENYSDVFYVLIDDLIDAAIKAQGAEAGGQAIMQRLRRWERLLETSLHGLSKSAQKGLFGELYVLENISETIGISRAIEAWLGPEAGTRDFEIDETGIEVKTTTTKGALSVQISSERQLELIAIKQLFLWCVSIEKVSRGTNLNSAVDKIRLLIGADDSRMESFQKKLLRVGYLESDKHRYQTDYVVRDAFIYQVDNQFPSITSETLDNCVYDVTYRIMLEGCVEWLVSRDEIFKGSTNE
jgi:hypothetical protein